MNLGVISQLYLNFTKSKNETFVRIFSNHIKKYQKQSEELFNSCRGENSTIVNEYYFLISLRVYITALTI